MRLREFLGPLRGAFVDLNLDEVRGVTLRTHASSLRRLYLPATVLRTDVVVSLPKLKTHHWAGVTLSLKNLFGIVPGSCYGWPKNILHWAGIAGAVLDINSAVRHRRRHRGNGRGRADTRRAEDVRGPGDG
jgi:uncharacterized protein (DUF362 family)